MFHFIPRLVLDLRRRCTVVILSTVLPRSFEPVLFFLVRLLNLTKYRLLPPVARHLKLAPLYIPKQHLINLCRRPQSVGHRNLSATAICRWPQSVGGRNLSVAAICRWPQSVGGRNLSIPQSVSGHNLSAAAICRRPQSVGGRNLSAATICQPPQSVSHRNLSAPQSVSGHNLSAPQSVGGRGLSAPQSVGGRGLSGWILVIFNKCGGRPWPMAHHTCDGSLCSIMAHNGPRCFIMSHYA